MLKRVIMFPGLGSEYPEMMSRYVSTFPEDKSKIERWETHLGVALRENPKQEGHDRINDDLLVQLQIHSLNILWWHKIANANKRNELIFCGHSLGFYSSLVACGAISTLDSFSLIKEVYQLGEILVPDNSQVICAITVKDGKNFSTLARDSKVEQVCSNSPYSYVACGTRAQLDLFVNKLGSQLVSRSIINAKLPYHSKNMVTIVEPLKRYVRENMRIKRPRSTLFSHIKATKIVEINEILWHICHQLSMKVIWHDMVRALKLIHINEFYEVGPNRILCKMIKWIDPAISTHFVDILAKKRAFSF